jgi:hypothetical protein
MSRRRDLRTLDDPEPPPPAVPPPDPSLGGRYTGAEWYLPIAGPVRPNAWCRFWTWVLLGLRWRKVP